MQMWVSHEDGQIDSGIIISVTQNLNGQKVWVELLAGEDMDSWVDDMEGSLKKFQDFIGAMCVEASCRPGLAKYLKRRGWKEKAIVMELS